MKTQKYSMTSKIVITVETNVNSILFILWIFSKAFEIMQYLSISSNLSKKNHDKRLREWKSLTVFEINYLKLG